MNFRNATGVYSVLIAERRRRRSPGTWRATTRTACLSCVINILCVRERDSFTRQTWSRRFSQPSLQCVTSWHNTPIRALCAEQQRLGETSCRPCEIQASRKGRAQMTINRSISCAQYTYKSSNSLLVIVSSP